MFLLFRRRTLLKLSRQIHCIANYSRKAEDDRLIERKQIRPYFFSKLLNMSNLKTKEMLNDNPALMYMDKKDIIKSVETLKSFNYDLKDIQSKPMILFVNSLTLENRYEVLKECGCVQISISVLTKFLTVMNRTIECLKIQSIIPYETNVRNQLENCFKDIEIKLKDNNIDDKIELKMLRQLVLNEYLRNKLNVTDAELEKLWRVYGRIRHRNYASICEQIEILQHELFFSSKRIISNGFVLYGDPKNAKRILDNIKSIGGEDIRDILYRKPKILMVQCDSILKSIEYIKKFDISEAAILKCIDILTLGPETILDRLEDLNEVKEFRVFKSNPRILRLVYFQNKAKYRLEFLNQIKIHGASLDILSCGSEKFQKFTLEGTDRNKSKDILTNLSHIFQKSEEDVKKVLSRHPNWYQVPLINIQKCYNFLILKLFTRDDIYNNMQLLLYPVKRIENKLHLLHSQEIYDKYKLNINPLIITNDQLLRFCLYLIEVEFHFTGDGIWDDDEGSEQQVENFSSIIPEFFENNPKVYKYGGKSTTQNLMESEISS